MTPNPSLERDLHRHGAWPARRSLSSSASRAKRHPGSGPSAQTLGVMKTSSAFLPQALASLALALTCALSCGTAYAAEPEIVVLSSTEEADGTTQADFDLPVLKMLERRSVETLRAKMTAYLRSQGQTAALPNMQSESHYVESQGVKLAVVRIRGKGFLNQAFIYGIRDKAFLRVACARTRNFDEAVPLFYGPCGEKIREVFGVAIKP